MFEDYRFFMDTRTKKPSAIDAADFYLRCGCRDPRCWKNDFRPLREHMGQLMRAISGCGVAGILKGGPQPWPGALYALHMAVSVEDVVADPSWMDESDAWIHCDTAWELDERQREFSSRYLAAAVIFNFVWIAYESAIENFLGTRESGAKLPVEAREFFKKMPVEDRPAMNGFAFSYQAARKLCSKFDDITEDIDKIERKYGLTDFPAAAELVRIFRNHVVHGKDPNPISTDSGNVSHYYTIVRLVLMLIQTLLLFSLDRKEEEILLSLIHDDQGTRPAEYVLMNLHRPEVRWLGQPSEDLSFRKDT